MTKLQTELSAYVELDDEVRLVNIKFVDSKFSCVYLSGELCDDIESWDDFLEEFGTTFYYSLEEYRKGSGSAVMFSDYIITNKLDTGDN
jgi:hypothetical protein